MERTDELKERIRQQPLNDRLEESRRRIGDMCSKGRCPKMTIPVQHDDDDFYINTTLADAQATIAALQAQLATCFKLSGADPDGNEDWRLAPHAVDEVTRLRNDYDELGDETEALRGQLTQRTAELEAAKQKAAEQGRYAVEMFDELKRVQAELERVKQALCDADERANEYQKALHDFESERALPLSIELERVRGELATYKETKHDAI